MTVTVAGAHSSPFEGERRKTSKNYAYPTEKGNRSIHDKLVLLRHLHHADMNTNILDSSSTKLCKVLT